MDGRILLVAIPACRKTIPPHPFHGVGEKYLHAAAAAASVTPLIVPALGESLSPGSLLGRIDGLMLTGSPSNVEPHHYQGAAPRPDTLHDPHRDATVLPLVRAAVAAGIPVLGICRGLQEINVALGGSLHPHLQEVDGRADHREPDTDDLAARYAPRHRVELAPGGLLRELAGCGQAQVNSLHEQGVERLADGLAVEAVAPDGQIEAFRLDDPGQYLLAVQWHPEWRVEDDPLSLAIFRHFGDTCREFMTRGARGRDHELV